ncbi:hypothetical protein EGW08_013811 [Elysia chlorotica]|uniref:Uncharacterized protein n=1 Tax=Elysia chlorotica TaxID=188477 RepID=A0A3S0ZIB2_ELYCH|nr:hypothetical protein EGW08_013811 [Elysia chlorotica]
MANIRFVKPPPDNRIRSFPYTTTQTQNTVNELKTSAGTHLETNTTLHITTPKRRKNYLPQWDIFITSKPDTDTTQTSTPRTSNSVVDSNHGKTSNNKNDATRKNEKNTSNKKKTKETSQNGPDFNCNQKSPTLKSPSESFASLHQVTPRVADIPDSASKSDCKVSREVDEGHLCNSEDATLVMPFQDSCQSDASSSPVSQGWVGQQKEKTDYVKSNAKIQNIQPKEKTANSSTGVGLSEVLEEEIASLPEVRSPRSISSPDNRLQDQGRQCTHNSTGEKVQNQQTSSSQRQEDVSNNFQTEKPINRNSSKLSLIGLPRRPYPIGPLRRSISEYDFYYENTVDDDEEEDVSFFSRVKNAKNCKSKRPNLQDTRVDSLDKSSGHENISGIRRFPKFAWAEGTVMNSAYFGGSDLVLSCNDRFALKNGRLSDSPSESDELSRSPTPVQEFVSPESLRRPSREAVYSARLAKRRFALADPERMIISQQMREKLERDVQRRKSSAVRKVSQFFNIQLGLNKEEDLI